MFFNFYFFKKIGKNNFGKIKCRRTLCRRQSRRQCLCRRTWSMPTAACPMPTGTYADDLVPTAAVGIGLCRRQLGLCRRQKAVGIDVRSCSGPGVSVCDFVREEKGGGLDGGMDHRCKLRCRTLSLIFCFNFKIYISDVWEQRARN